MERPPETQKLSGYLAKTSAIFDIHNEAQTGFVDRLITEDSEYGFTNSVVAQIQKQRIKYLVALEPKRRKGLFVG